MPLFPKFYWENREGDLSIAGCGIGAENPAGRAFTWRSFCPKLSPEWEDFSLSSINPRFEMRMEQGEIFPSGVNRIKEFVFERPRIENITSSHERGAWIEHVQEALLAIRNREFEKVVLAKRVQIDCTAPINALGLFSLIKRSGQSSFFIQPNPTSAFLGASPERLYRRTGNRIECDALAGTRPKANGHELLLSQKDLHEFNIVKETLTEILSPLCNFLPTATPTTLAETPTLCHLYSKVSGYLRDGIDDLSLLKMLHPTPAVGGHPREAAASFLAKTEPFTRGLYAAPIGYIGKEQADFTVGIRSCLVKGSKAYLFAGTGIVENSNPEAEWEESEQKLSHWRSLFL
jgi:menaquinone-specific isochorismate synthase